MECPKCGSKNIRVGVSVFMYVSPKEAHRLTKKAIQKKTTERGWAGHFVSADRCKFRRNTLLEYQDIKIVVSSVGLMVSLDGSRFEEIGVDRYFETMCFYSNLNDTRYYDIDVRRQIHPHSNWQISEIDADDRANVMHNIIVEEMKGRLLSGEL